MAWSVPDKIRADMARFGMLPPDGRILAAVSGGADSVCLLLALQEIGADVCAVHVEHGIRGEESLADCEYVRQLCEEHSIRLRVISVDALRTARLESMSLEEAARYERYKAFHLAADETGIRSVATAHHRMDQAETVIWNLIRGSSVAGLAGIKPVREEDGITFIRPLIGCEREEIEEYLRQRGVSWRTDRTNADTQITRNAIRLKVLPLLESLNAGAIRHITAAADDLRDAEEFLEEKTEAVFREVVLEGAGESTKDLLIDRDRLQSCKRVIRLRVLRKIIGQMRGGLKDITRSHVEAMDQLCSGDCGHRVSLPGGIEAVSEAGILRLRERNASGAGRRFSVTVEYSAADEGKNTSGVGRKESAADAGENISGAGNAGTGQDEIALASDGIYSVHGEDGTLSVQVSYINWNGGAVPKKQYTKYLAYDTMLPCLTLRTRRPGDYLIINHSGGRRKLKDYLIDEKIPRDRRDSLWLITQGSHVLWVIGMRISEGAKVRDGIPAVRIQVRPETDSDTSFFFIDTKKEEI